MSSIYLPDPKNSTYIVGFETAIDFRTTTVSIAVPTTDGLLHSLTIPRNSFVRNGQRIWVIGRGSTTGAGNKRVRLQLSQVGGLTGDVFESGLINIQNGWIVEAQLLRLSSNSLETEGSIVHNVNIVSATGAAVNYLEARSPSAPIDFTADITLNFLGTVAGTDTISQTSSYISIL